MVEYPPHMFWKDVGGLRVNTKARLTDTGIPKVEQSLQKAKKALRDLREHTIQFVCSETEKLGGTFWGIRKIEKEISLSQKEIFGHTYTEALSGKAIFTYEKIPYGSYSCKWFEKEDIVNLIRMLPLEKLPALLDDVGKEGSETHTVLRGRLHGSLPQMPRRQDLMDLINLYEKKSRRLYWVIECCRALIKEYAFGLSGYGDFDIYKVFRLWFGPREYLFVRGVTPQNGCISEPDNDIVERRFDVE